MFEQNARLIVCMDSRNTLTAPESPDLRWHEAAEPPLALRAWSATIGNEEHELDPDKTSFLCGAAPDCDVQIDDAQVSGHHAMFERRGGPDRGEQLRIIDRGSKNGIRLGGKRLTSFDVGVGQPFQLARSVTVLPMSAAMRTARLRLFETYGAAAGVPELPLDQLLIEAIGSGHMLVLGEVGCGHEALARAVHAVSVRRTIPPEVAELSTDPGDQQALIRRAVRSTLILGVKPDMPPASDTFLDEVMGPQHEIRVIAHAPSLRVATKALGAETVGRMRHVLLRPMRTRVHELRQIFDQLVMAQGSTLRLDHLSAQHQQALREYTWPGNFDELAGLALRVAAIAPSATHIVPVREVALALGRAESWVYALPNRIGLHQFWKSLNVGE